MSNENLDPASPKAGEKAREIMEKEADKIARALEDRVAELRKMTKSD